MSTSSSAQILELRALLKERFPEAHAQAPAPLTIASPPLSRSRPGNPSLPLPTQSCLEQLDVPPGSVVEIIAAQSSCGSALLLSGLIEQHLARGGYAALIDGRDSFDPHSLSPSLLPRLLWIRCQRTPQVIQVADLLLRDGNLPLIIADLTLNTLRDLRNLQDSTWYRLRALAENSGSTFFAFTPKKLVASARLRICLNHRFHLDALDQSRDTLLQQLRMQTLLDRRRTTPWPVQHHTSKVS